MDSHDATRALGEIALGRKRAFELKGYATAGSVVIAWGLVWLAANLASYALPARAPLFWAIGIAAALLWTITRPRQDGDLRIFATWAVAVGFMTLVAAIARVDFATSNLLVSIFVGAAYLVMGIWVGARFALLGAVLVAVALLAWFFVPTQLFLWLGLAGGGTLILGGYWLARA